MEKLPPDPPQPPDDPPPRPFVKSFSTKEQKIAWLTEHPSVLRLDEDAIVELMREEGLISKKTYRYDVRVEPLVWQARRRLAMK